MSASKKWKAVLVGGPDCGKEITIGVRAMMLKDGSTYEITSEQNADGRQIYLHSWKGVCS